ncbi:winged helix DNA-binding protein [Paraglaciecola chathamensis]|uniref:winged helix DNA-binding protein n=1 Tax=Paraglaciecola chathamensis TaxID=368405 RepID=UPI0020904D44
MKVSQKNKAPAESTEREGSMSQSDKVARGEPRRKIVSSEHLASDENWPLSEVEYGMTVVYNAFSQWMVRCANAAGIGELAVLDILILHNINHRNREKRLSDIAFILNIIDTHTVNYAIKKLLKLELVTGTKRGKEIFYATSPKGKKACEDYGRVREQCLLDGLKMLDVDQQELAKLASTLRSMSGLYDQASRAAASL